MQRLKTRRAGFVTRCGSESAYLYLKVIWQAAVTILRSLLKKPGVWWCKIQTTRRQA